VIKLPKRKESKTYTTKENGRRLIALFTGVGDTLYSAKIA
jgi:hypothetical protein